MTFCLLSSHSCGVVHCAKNVLLACVFLDEIKGSVKMCNYIFPSILAPGLSMKGDYISRPSPLNVTAPQDKNAKIFFFFNTSSFFFDLTNNLFGDTNISFRIVWISISHRCTTLPLNSIVYTKRLYNKLPRVISVSARTRSLRLIQAFVPNVVSYSM